MGWNIAETTDRKFSITSTLPVAHLAVTRSFSFHLNKVGRSKRQQQHHHNQQLLLIVYYPSLQISVQTEVKPTQARDWPQQIEWCEHATFGDPFLVSSMQCLMMICAYSSREDSRVYLNRLTRYQGRR